MLSQSISHSLRLIACLLLCVSLNTFASIDFITDKEYFFSTYGDYLTANEDFDDYSSPSTDSNISQVPAGMNVDFETFTVNSEGWSQWGGLWFDSFYVPSSGLSAQNQGFIAIEIDPGFNIFGMEIGELFIEPSAAEIRVIDVNGNSNSTYIDDLKFWNNSSNFIGVIATNNLSRIEFEAYDIGGGGGNYFESIDNVVMGEVPLPAGIYLFLSGLIGLVGVKLRGRNA